MAISSKSAVLYLGQSNVRQCYTIKQASISSVSLMCDLGIVIDNKLAMSQHINKAQSRASLIFKCFHSKHQATLLKAFVTYVRPLLEYASPVWSPSTITDITKMESVKRSFTKRLPGLKSLSYSKRLEVLGIDSLEVRRLRCGLIYVHKMLFGLVDHFTLRLSSTTRGHASV